MPVCGTIILPLHSDRLKTEKTCALYTNPTQQDDDHGTIHLLICVNVS